MHKKIWFKVHWILGITAGIILLIVGVTGATLSFEKEIMKFINKDSYTVTIPENKNKLTTKELLEKFQLKNAKAKINSISITNDLSSSVVINVAGTGKGKAARRGINYYVNPYTAEILPDLKGKDFFSFILRLHRWLALEGDAREVGKQTVAISTVALIILVISGIIVYWGRIKHAFFKSFTFKFKHKGRAFLSTMHSAIGMWVIPFYLLAALTGLYWSYGWYNTMLYKIAGVEKPQRMAPPKQQKREKEVQIAQKDFSLEFENIQKAIDKFDLFIQKDYYTFTIRLPQKGTIYTFNYLRNKSDYIRHSNKIELDIDSLQILKHERFEDKPLNERLMKSILPLHTGEYFGIIGQIGMFLASSLMALFTITGFMLFFNRHKKKKKSET